MNQKKMEKIDKMENNGFTFKKFSSIIQLL